MALLKKRTVQICVGVILFVLVHFALYSQSNQNLAFPSISHIYNLSQTISEDQTQEDVSATTTSEPVINVDVGPLINLNFSFGVAQPYQSGGVSAHEPKGDKSFPCEDVTTHTYYGPRRDYWVLYNYFKATRSFRCDQSITYTTHSDWTFLDNLFPLLERWQGPLSLTLYAPGTDFDESVKRIQYLRECSDHSPIVKELVTFHLFFDQAHIPPKGIPKDPETLPVNCSTLPSSVTFGEGLQTYKKANKLFYPVNIGRNVARDMATTHYVFPSDIELYPNPNIIPNFLEMIRRNDTVIQGPSPKVFVLSIFELETDVQALPQDKHELIHMLGNKSAIPFHKFVCSNCHRIPRADAWLKEPFQPGMRVFHVGKRLGEFHHWEPIFIGTKYDPSYDERLSWEGKKDKMTHGYVLCVLDYEFHILDNAFLVHRPGIKRIGSAKADQTAMSKQNSLISNKIFPELKRIYGTRPGCTV